MLSHPQGTTEAFRRFVARLGGAPAALLTLLLVLGVPSQRASAAQLTFYTGGAISQQSEPFSQTLSFQVPQFNPDLGTLQSVTLQLDYTFQSDSRVENLDPVQRTVVHGATGTCAIMDAGSQALGTAVATILFTNKLAANTVPPDKLYARPYSATQFPQSRTVSWTGTVTGSLGAYIGTDTTPMSAVITATKTVASPPQYYELIDYLQACLGKAGYSLAVIFDYVEAPKGATIGDFVWNDLNGDGVQDPGEPGIAGVTVSIYDEYGAIPSGFPPTQTDASGYYSFQFVPAGNYTIVVDPPVGFVETYDFDGVDASVSAAVSVADGDNFADGDFGFYQPVGTIGDRVWRDDNGDGVQDSSEPGIENATVTLLDASGTVVLATTTTDSNGTYGFSGAAAGTYQIAIGGVPASYPASYDVDGTGTPNVATVTLAAGATLDTVDFGYQPQTASVAGTVWRDSNRDGVADTAETRLAGVVVSLYDTTGTRVLATAGTDANGGYSFAGLSAGHYVVTVTAPSGYWETSDPDGVGSANQAALNLSASEARADFNFGYSGISLGDRVWNDLNGDGVQDAGEPGLPGATVTLSTGDTTTTDANGFYGFANLPVGTYTVTVSVPTGWVPSYDPDGTSTPNGASVTLVAGSDRTDVDFGYQEQTAQVGDRVWRDDNGNGIQDGGEPGLAGVTVRLLNSTGNTVLATATTGANGYYSFGGLAAGTYIVAAAQPAHHLLTYDLDGFVVPNWTSVVLAAGQSRNDVDFGYQPLSMLGSLVWLDLDGNAAPDPNGFEPGLSGAIVTATGTGGTYSTVTDGNGEYVFGDIPPGTYTVAVTPPSGVVPTYDVDGVVTPNVATITIAPATDRLDVDFGYGIASNLSDGQIGDLVWLDSNANGYVDGTETGLANVSLTLLDENGVSVATATSDTTTGYYLFSGLPAGTYTVVVSAPPGKTETFDLDGLATPNQATVTIANGEHRYDVDFGYRVPPPLKARVAGVVWNDADGNRYANNGETGLPGITVTLGNAGGTVATATTDPSGAYAFLDIPAGAYVVAVAPPTYWGPTFDIDGIGTANTAGLSVAAGQNRTGVDFGYQYSPPPGSIGDRVWNDANNNGVQDAGEAGVANVVVAIKDSTGQTLASVATDSNGYYGFQSVSAGTYRISIAAPQYWDATADLDGVATPNTSLVTIQIGQDRTDVDFGLQYNPPPALIGDLVWNDKNSNGVQDAGEAGLGNVAVTLVDTANHVVATTTTDAAGKYEFPALSAGSYTVKIVAPQYYIPTYDLDGFATPNKASLAVAIGETNRLADFGLIYAPPLGSIGQYVWSDLNSNGVRDPGEPGVQGVAVTLRDAHNAVLAATTTDSDGSYAFSGLRAQTYSVTVAPPQGATATFDLDGVATPNVASVPLAIGQDRADANFGYHLYVAPPLGSIGDLVWVDSNNNGVQDGSESGLTNAVVTLRNGLNAVVGTATTDATGRYSFASLPADTYTVTVVPPANFFPTFDVDGIISPNTATLTLPSGANRTDVDFGYVYIAPAPSVATIGDTVWADGNHNGLRDAGEPGLAYVAVSLRNAANTVIAVTTTDSSGTYHFANVAAGNYSVVVTPPDGSVPTYDIDGIGTANVASFVVAAGVNRGDIDFGYLPPQLATIGDRVWVDANSNGIQEAAEVGLTGVPVVLYNSSNTQVAATTTGANGSYLFPNLVAGTYRVAVTPPANYGPTFDADSITTPNTATVTVAWGESRLNVDFGYVYTPGTGRIGDLVWIDKNGNGARDTGETGLPNAAVKLYNRTTGALLATTATDSNGAYLFPGLPAGSYTVTVTPPAGYTATYDLDGVLTPDTTVVVLASGQARLDADFGYMITPSGKGVGASPGFWSHNGLSSVTPADLAVLSALRLVNDDGTDADFVNPTTGAYGGAYGANYLAARTAFGAFEAKATAVNMASQLSRQLAAFVLDMRHGEFSPTKLMPCPAAPGGSCTAQAMIDLANAALIANPVTTSSNAASAYEESIKNSLESGYMTFGTP